jgi:hypothetical protein
MQSPSPADLSGGHFRVVGEVEALQGGGAGQVGGPQAAGDRPCFSAGQLVLAEHLEELDMAERAGSRFGQAGVEGL